MQTEYSVNHLELSLVNSVHQMFPLQLIHFFNVHVKMFLTDVSDLTGDSPLAQLKVQMLRHGTNSPAHTMYIHFAVKDTIQLFKCSKIWFYCLEKQILYLRCSFKLFLFWNYSADVMQISIFFCHFLSNTRQTKPRVVTFGDANLMQLDANSEISFYAKLLSRKGHISCFNMTGWG